MIKLQRWESNKMEKVVAMSEKGQLNELTKKQQKKKNNKKRKENEIVFLFKQPLA